MSIEDMVRQYYLWAAELGIAVLKAWMIIYSVATIFAYHLGV